MHKYFCHDASGAEFIKTNPSISLVDEHEGVGKLITRMESIPKKALALASEIFEGLQIHAVLSKVELTIEINKGKEKPAYQKIIDGIYYNLNLFAQLLSTCI